MTRSLAPTGWRENRLKVDCGAYTWLPISWQSEIQSLFFSSSRVHGALNKPKRESEHSQPVWHGAQFCAAYSILPKPSGAASLGLSTVVSVWTLAAMCSSHAETFGNLSRWVDRKCQSILALLVLFKGLYSTLGMPPLGSVFLCLPWVAWSPTAYQLSSFLT